MESLSPLRVYNKISLHNCKTTNHTDINQQFSEKINYNLKKLLNKLTVI